LQLDKSDEERAIALHTNSTVVLIHEDVLSIDVAEQRSRGAKRVAADRHLPLLRRGGVDVLCATVGGTSLHSTFPVQLLHTSGSDPLKRSLELVAYLYDDIAECPEEAAIVTDYAGIRQALAGGRLAVLLGLEGADMVQGSPCALRVFHLLGVRIVQPAWIMRNMLADGTWERGNAGLSNAGVTMIRELNRLGMVVDVSHAQEAAFWDILSVSESPVIASHSNARAICQHPRNLTDDQIRALAAKGGVVGLTMNFTTNEETPGRWELAGSLDDLLNHVDYISRLVGTEHVGLGLDLNEAARFPEELYSAIWRGTTYGFDFAYPAELSSVSLLPNFTRGLVARGYHDGEIEAILGGNFLRVLNQVLK